MDVEAAPPEESVDLLHQTVPAGVDTETHILTSCNIDMSINI